MDQSQNLWIAKFYLKRFNLFTSDSLPLKLLIQSLHQIPLKRPTEIHSFGFAIILLISIKAMNNKLSPV
jgi:hypothetical protein